MQLKELFMQETIDEAKVGSWPFTISAAEFEEIWARFIALETPANGKPPVNLLGSVAEYRRKFKQAAT